MKTAIVLATLIATGATTASAASLLANGDFESGDTGFSSDYLATPSNTNAAQYAITTDPNIWNGSFSSFADHTTGTGNMMAVNGGTSAGAVVWSETVDIMANTEYSFTGWIADLFSGDSSVSLVINGATLGLITAPTTVRVWEDFAFCWFSGANTSVTISLLQASTGFVGNDYALDDLSFSAKGISPIPLPAGLPLLMAGLGGLALLRRRTA